MSTHFELRVVTPNRQLLDEQVREVTAPGTLGEFGVLPDHITFLTSLEIGPLTYRTDASTQRLAVRGGFAEVINNVMTVLADDAVLAENVNVEAARAQAQEAEAALKAMSPADDGYAALDDERRWALARIEAATKH
jgi:F-type H+-transporting ATPase subunit epsilon